MPSWRGWCRLPELLARSGDEFDFILLGVQLIMLTVIQTPTFQRTAKAFWSEEDVFEFVAFIAEHPDAGDVIPGTGALRKVRWSRAGMGKRGGARVVYFVRNAAGEVVLVVAYAKGNAENLPTEFLNRLKELYGA